jgi:hypothetical protein
VREWTGRWTVSESAVTAIVFEGSADLATGSTYSEGSGLEVAVVVYDPARTAPAHAPHTKEICAEVIQFVCPESV